MRRILIIRRENIGDLVCTTPLIHAIRRALPDAHIAVLANDYNAPVLAGNDDIDIVHAYTKAKHAEGLRSTVRGYLRRASQLWHMRQFAFDDIVLAEPMYTKRNIRLAKWLKAGRATTRIIGFEGDDGDKIGLDVVMAQDKAMRLHMAQFVFRLAAAFDINAAPARVPPCRVVAATAHVVYRDPTSHGVATVALHISARKPSQRWQAEHFAALATMLASRGAFEFKLFWSPGDEDNPLHPGDDKKAAAVLALLGAAFPITPMPTATLRALIDGLATTDAVICADGGAMHVAAGLGKPIVALFGDSDARRWHPWGVSYRLLQKPSRDVADIAPMEVADAFFSLAKECGFTAIGVTVR